MNQKSQFIPFQGNLKGGFHLWNSFAPVFACKLLLPLRWGLNNWSGLLLFHSSELQSNWKQIQSVLLTEEKRSSIPWKYLHFSLNFVLVWFELTSYLCFLHWSIKFMTFKTLMAVKQMKDEKWRALNVSLISLRIIDIDWRTSFWWSFGG